MEPFASIVVLAIVVLVAFGILKFLLKLTFRAIGCVLSAIVVLGILAIIFFFFL